MSRRKYDVNDNYFDVIDTQEKAYFFGLLYADGCNYEDDGIIKIDLNEDDVEILEKLSKAIGYTGKIKYYDKETEKRFEDGKVYPCKPIFRLIFRSKRISEQLAIKGCVYNKSMCGMFPNDDVIPENLLNHFIRGYMDGNGGISYWIDNKNTGHKKFSIHCCGTTDIIQRIADFFSTKFDCAPDVRSRYEERDNNNVQFLIDGNRKYDKYILLKEEIKRVVEDTTLYGNAYKRRPVINLETKEIYSGVNKAGVAFGVHGSTIFSWCKKHKNVMYLDEYEAS